MNKKDNRVFSKDQNIYTEPPNEMPICFKNRQIGSIIVRLDEKCLYEIMNENKLPTYMPLEFHILFFKKLLESEIEMNIRNRESMCASSILINSLSLVSSIPSFTNVFLDSRAPSGIQGGITKKISQTFLGNYILFNEDALFNLVKKEGPLVLCNIDAQEKMLDFLSDEKNANSNMDKLKKALLEYSYGAKKVLSKRGRTSNNILTRLGASNIKKCHKLITIVLKHIKKYAKESFVHKANYGSFILSLDTKEEIVDKIIATAFDDEKVRGAGVLEVRRLMLEILVNDVCYAINNEKDSAQEFIAFKWEPNKLASRIFAKALSISISKIEKILYT